MPGARPAPGLHGRAGGRGPRGDARRDGRARRRPGAHQPARAGRPRHRPQRPGRPLRAARRVRLQRGPRVRAQRRALPAAALGAVGAPRLPRRAAGHGHRPPGEPRVPRAGRRSARRAGEAPGRLPGHPRGHRLPHDDDQRPRRPGLRRRRHRGGGRAARPAAVPAAPPGRRRPPHGELPRGSTATDLVLVISQMLRAHGVVGKFVEFAGDGLASLALADRATIANMSPEYGATTALFPDRRGDARLPAPDRADARRRSRSSRHTRRSRRCGAGPAPSRTSTRRSSSTSGPSSRASPVRGVPRTASRCGDLRDSFRAYPATRHAAQEHARSRPPRPRGGRIHRVVPGQRPSRIRQRRGDDGQASRHPRSPSLARVLSARDGPRGRTPRSAPGRWRSRPSRAARTPPTRRSWSAPGCSPGTRSRGASRSGPTVKTSLAPGSRAVTQYLSGAGLLPYLETLGFDVVGYGCTTCIGNSRPARRARRPGRSTTTGSWSRRSSRATATSRAASTRWCGPPTSPRRRSWSHSRSPAASTST